MNEKLPATPRPKPKAELLKDFLNNPKFLEAMRKRSPVLMDPERLTAIAVSACQRNPDLLECTQASILMCLINAVDLGLEIGGHTGLAYMVPFDNKHTKKKEAAMIVGYRGYIHLALDGGKVLKIEARAVRDGDEFDLDLGVGNIKHRPKIKRLAREDDAGSPIEGIPFPEDFIGCYAVATLADGKTCVPDWMDEVDIDRIRRKAKSQTGPWSTDAVEMARKTVVRRLAKYLPVTPKLSRAMAIEESAENGHGAQGMRDVTPDLSAILPDEPEQLPPANPAEEVKEILKAAEQKEPVKVEKTK